MSSQNGKRKSFNENVRDFIRHYQGNLDLEKFEKSCSQRDELFTKMVGILERPDKKGLKIIHELAYNFAQSQLDLYQAELSLITRIANDLDLLMAEGVSAVRAIPRVHLRGPSDTKRATMKDPYRDVPGDPLYKTPEEKAALVAKANAASRARGKLYRSDVLPLEIAVKRARTLIKAIAGRPKTQFPIRSQETITYAKKMPSGAPVTKEITTTTHDAMGDDREKSCASFAAHQFNFVKDAVGDDDGKAYRAVLDGKQARAARLIKRDAIIREESRIRREAWIAKLKSNSDELRDQATKAVEAKSG